MYMEKKKVYYIVKNSEFPNGIIFYDKEGALAEKEECRQIGEKATLRKVLLTESYVNSLQEP